MKWTAIALPVLALSLAVLALLSAGERGDAAEARAVDLLVVHPSGQLVEFNFLVRAPDDAAAAEAARIALASLVPGATVVEGGAQADRAEGEGSVTAAFAPWGWGWADSEIPVAIAYNPAGATAPGEAPLTSALNTWTSVSGSRFAFSYAGQTAAVPGTHDAIFDGLNVVGWLDLDCAQGCVLGLTSKDGEHHEVDVILNANPAARLGDGTNGTVDLETTILHEAGHVAGLEHSCQAFIGVCSDAESTAVMFFRYLGRHRTLGPDDVAGLISRYPDPNEPRQAPNEGLPVEGVGDFEVTVQPGWSLVALPAGDLNAIMQSLPCVEAVYTWDGALWLSWLRDGSAALNTLATAEPGSAFWAYSSGTCSASLTAAH
jgi:hypothetical protein